MTWMNEFDILTARNVVDTYRAGTGWDEAVDALERLVEWTNDNSDGWPYWTKPSNAAKRLQEAILADVDATRRGFTNPDLDPDSLNDLLRPVKAFLTRQGVDWREVL